MPFLLAVLFVTIPAACSFQHLLDDFSLPDILARCVATAARNFFDEGEVIMYILPQNGSDPFMHSAMPFNRRLLGELYRTRKWSLFVNSPNLSKNVRKRRAFARKSDNYIMVVNTAEDIYDALNYLAKERMLNPFAKFVIINTHTIDDFFGDIEGVLNKLWSFNILSGVILFPDGDFPDAFDVYTWNPFADGKCGVDVDTVILTGICNETILRGNDKWFVDKIPNNLNGCPIYARTIITPPFVMDYTMKVDGVEDEYVFEYGIDIQLLNLVAEIANFTVHYSMSGKSDDYGGNFMKFPPNSTFNESFPQFPSKTDFWSMVGKNASTGILDMLRSKKVDIGIGSMSISLNAPDLEISFPYSQDALIYCVPHSREIPHWKKMSNIIDGKTWFATVCTVILTFFVIRTSARRYNYEFSTFKKSLDVGFILLQIITANIIKIQPRMAKVRMYLMLWIIFSLYFDTAYQTSLMSTLTGVDYEDQIKSQEEILKSDLNLLFLESSMQYFRTWHGGDTPELREIKQRWKICHNLHECMERTAFKKDSAVATSRLYTAYEMGNYLSPKGQPLLFCFKDNIILFPIVMYMRTGYPLKERINKLIYRIDAAGFVDYWTTNIFHTKVMTEHKSGCQADVHLTFAHIVSIFIILLIGNMIAVLVFLAELAVYRYRDKKFRARGSDNLLFKNDVRETEFQTSTRNKMRAIKINK